MARDLVIYFRTENMDQPKLLYQESKNHPGEVAILASFVPTFMKEQEQEKKLKIIEEERPELSSSATSNEKNMFIFIVDRSGSMSGETMVTTVEALKLFV